MGANRIPDENNREQLLEYGVLTVTAPDGTKMGAKVVTLKASSGTTLDDWRNNTEGALLASAARTGGVSPNQTNYNAVGVYVILNITVASGTGGLQVKIIGVDPVSGSTYQINLSPTAIVTTGRYAYAVYPGATATATNATGWVAQFTPAPLPRTWSVQVGAGDGTSYTYSVGYQLIVG